MARRTTNRKQQGTVLKQAWEWADYTEPENVINDNVESAYRINTSACSPGNCRRNCKANPNCFNCLGERFWLSEIKDSYWLNCEDPENERRPENAFVGLKNLGATCYVNTFLQVWFHNPVFRSAMYKYISPTSGRPEQEVKRAVNGLSTSEALSSSPNNSEVTNHSSHNGETSNKPAKDSSKLNHHNSENGGSLDKPLNVPTTPSKVSAVEQVPLLPSTTILNSDEAPTTVCGHLQLLFAQLQYSFRRYIDPSPFVDSLGLDTAQQQDAQEFSKLFTSLLEETFSKQAEPEVQNIVQSQFGGEYFYVTECLRCGNKSKRLSRFYELDLNIQGHSSLNQCIKEFLKEEKLDGDNQYYCTQCNSKQNAARYIELHSLPPVLNLQLLRFVFDRKTGYKKKLNSFIQFPDNLDMTEHVKSGGSGSNHEYELSAVLMHFGVSAYSGHYVAHIRDKKSGSWYKFNDEDIVKMQGKLKLSQDEDSTDTSPKPAKRPKCAQGFHVSKNAYTLVYTLKGHKGVGSEDDDVEVPPHVLELVAMDNSLFEHWVTQVKTFRQKLIAKGQESHSSFFTSIFRARKTTAMANSRSMRGLVLIVGLLAALAATSAFVGPQAPSVSRGEVSTMRAAGEYTGFVPDMQRRQLMNFVLVTTAGIPVLVALGCYLWYFVPPVAGGGGGAQLAGDVDGNPVTLEAWVKGHKDNDRELVQGLKGEPFYLISTPDNIKDFALLSVCTHLGCVVPWNKAANKFCCPCHGSQYDENGKVVRGPAPLSLALAHTTTIEGKLALSPWTEQDFRTGLDPWWK